MKNTTEKRKAYPFRTNDWITHIIFGIILGALFTIVSGFLCDNQLQNMSQDMSNISITFSFTFLGFLISAYAILQTVVEGLPDAESLRKMEITREEKFRKRAIIRLKKSDLFITFKGNLLRIAFLSLMFLLISIGLKPAIYLGNNIALYIVNGLEMFGIVFIATSGYSNLKTLFSLI